MVPSTVLRLVITSPIIWSRWLSADENALVSDRTLANAPPCPCNSWMTALLIVLTLLASRPLTTGRSPPSSASRSNAGCVCWELIVAPGGSLRSSPGPDVISRNRSPTRFSYRITARVEEYSVYRWSIPNFTSIVLSWLSFIPDTDPTGTPAMRTF